ncbi:MAG: peroxidase [Alphaproteobacteria bacterium]|nr:MAG: peroxidase [Alphaproteobacteria bacterium]
MARRNSYLELVNGPPNPLQEALGLNKAAGEMVNAYHQVVMRGESSISPALREAIAAFVSTLNMCPLCSEAHTRVAELLGVDPDVILALRKDVEGAPVREKERPLFAYAKKMTLAPSTLSKTDAERVFKAGWNDRDLHDVINVICIFNFINRFVLGHGIEVSEADVEYSAQMLASKGYWDGEKVPALGDIFFTEVRPILAQ